MVGMHWGPAISILKLLAVSGMRPAFPFDPRRRQLLRSRPFYYLFSRLAAIYLAGHWLTGPWRWEVQAKSCRVCWTSQEAFVC